MHFHLRKYPFTPPSKAPCGFTRQPPFHHRLSHTARFSLLLPQFQTLPCLLSAAPARRERRDSRGEGVRLKEASGRVLWPSARRTCKRYAPSGHPGKSRRLSGFPRGRRGREMANAVGTGDVGGGVCETLEREVVGKKRRAVIGQKAVWIWGVPPSPVVPSFHSCDRPCSLSLRLAF